MKPLVLTLVVANFLSASAAPLIVAHRGASHDAPENTIASFKLAWSQGADAIEGDIHLSSDGKILCIHDKDTQRVAGKKLIVKNTPLAELQSLDVGEWKGEKWKGSLHPSTDTILKTLKRIKADGVSTKADPRITSDFIRTVKQAGYSYHVWTINKLADAKHFEQLGVDSIITNRLAYIRSALQN